MSISGQKKNEELLEKNVFKVVIPSKIILLEKIPNSTQRFNTCFFANIKNLYINKAYEKNRSIVHAYNNNKKILYYSIYQKYQSSARILVYVLLLLVKIMIMIILSFIYRILCRHTLKLF